METRDLPTNELSTLNIGINGKANKLYEQKKKKQWEFKSTIVKLNGWSLM